MSTKKIERALALFKQKKFAEALHVSSKVFKKEPSNINAMLIASICSRELGKLDTAIKLIERVIYLAPNFEEALLQRGIALLKLKKVEDSLDDFNLVLSKKNDNYEALIWKGLALIEKTEMEEAFNTFNRALILNPLRYEAFFNRGLLRKQLGQLTEAISDFDQALELQPQLWKCLIARGDAYFQLKKFQSALSDFHQAYTFNSNSKFLREKIGLTYTALEDFESALKNFTSILEDDPASYVNLLNKAAALSHLGRYDEAIIELNKSISRKPDYAMAYNNLGLAYQAKSLYEKALENFNKAQALDPKLQDPKSNRALLLLLLGSFEEAWEDYESRLNFTNRNFPIKTAKNSIPLWGGETGKKILVWQEQGIGDEIMFASMLPALEKQSDKISMICDKRLLKIFSRSFPNISFFTKNNRSGLTDFDYQISIGSLGRFFRKTFTDFDTKEARFLEADQDLAAEFKQQFSPKKRPLIGVSWKSEVELVGEQKSIQLHKLLEALSVNECEFVSLQYGDVDKEMADQRIRAFPINFATNIDKKSDMDSLFSLVASCDTVVTISNATAHIAGALGVPTTVLVNNQVNWRWHHELNHSYWYKSVRILRAECVGDWDNALKTLGAGQLWHR